MKFITKFWGENGHFIAKALLYVALAIISLICGFIFDSILPIFIVLGYCFTIPACWFCFKYARKNKEELE
jgi:hypothetical protein